MPLLRIDPMTVNLRKDGSVGPSSGTSSIRCRPRRILRPSDRVILSRLERRTYGSRHQPDDDTARNVATDPADRQSLLGFGGGGAALTEAPERRGQAAWITRADASQQATLSLDEGLIGVRIHRPGMSIRKPGRWVQSASICHVASPTSC